MTYDIVNVSIYFFQLIIYKKKKVMVRIGSQPKIAFHIFAILAKSERKVYKT